MQKLWVLVLAWIVGCSLQSSAAVIRIEKDGSGDYTVIQDAVDAANDGDVIEIGPGRYDDYTTDPQWGDFRVWLYGDKNLSLVGAGPSLTIIGPEDYSGDERDWGIFGYSGNVRIRIEGIGFENLDHAGVVCYSSIFEVVNCQFSYCNDALQYRGGGTVLVESCQFTNDLTSFPKAIHVTAISARIMDIEVYGHRTGIQVDGGSNDNLVSNCLFDGQGFGQIGIFFDNVGGEIVGCTLKNFTAVGFASNRPRIVQLTSNAFSNVSDYGRNVGKGIHLYNGGDSFEATGNIISGCDSCFKVGSPIDEFNVYGNHFFRDTTTEGLFIETNSTWDNWEFHFDFSQNYWGTTDIEEISQYIIDANDNTGTTVYIDFLPIADGPVPTAPATLGGIKAMFR